MENLIDKAKLDSLISWHRGIFRKQHNDSLADELISWSYNTLQWLSDRPYAELECVSCPSCGKDYFLKRRDVSDRPFWS